MGLYEYKKNIIIYPYWLLETDDLYIPESFSFSYLHTTTIFITKYGKIIDNNNFIINYMMKLI
jgi:hypothetical protein